MPSVRVSREIDLGIAARIAHDVRMETDDSFVLTGSYSIDLLTGADVTHNDIDANIFTRDVDASLGRIGLLLESKHDNLTRTLRTGDRLEYRYPHQYGASELELQFVAYTEATDTGSGIDYTLPSTRAGSKIIVPTVVQRANISETSGETYEFAIKSLPFAIATWALRISGLALNQKRAVRQTDIDHFAYLVDAPHDDAAVVHAIMHHPQIPAGVDAQAVLDRALTVLDTGASHG